MMLDMMRLIRVFFRRARFNQFSINYKAMGQFYRLNVPQPISIPILK